MVDILDNLLCLGLRGINNLLFSHINIGLNTRLYEPFSYKLHIILFIRMKRGPREFISHLLDRHGNCVFVGFVWSAMNSLPIAMPNAFAVET